MRKQAKGLIALCITLSAMLGCGYAVLELTSEDKGGNTKTTEPSLIATEAVGKGTVLVSDDSENGVVKSVLVKNSEGEFKAIMKDAPTEDGESATYTLEGYEDLKVVSTNVAYLADNANGMQADSLIASACGELGKYGLDKPEIEVEVVYGSGKTVKFYVGDKAPSNSVNYVRVDGSNDVYAVTASTLDYYSKPINYFIDKTVLEKPADENYPIVNSLRIERGDMDEDILIEYDKDSEKAHSGGTSAAHKMIKPIESYLAIENSNEITNGMFGLAASDIYVLNCKEADIAGAGLSEPFCKVTMDCDDGNKYVLLLSESFTDDSGNKCCYGMLEGGKVIYILSVDSAKWLTVQPIDIVSRLLITSYVWNIPNLSASGGGESAEFVITPKDKDNLPENPTSEDFMVHEKGKDFDSERYRLFYSFLSSTNAEEFAIGKPVPDGEPLAVIEYTDSFSGKDMKYEFYDDSVMRALIVVNGESKYYCTKSYVNTLIENIKRIGTGEDYITNW